MKHPALLTVVGICAFVLVLVTIVNVNAISEAIPVPDRSLRITLPDGRFEPLGQLFHRVEVFQTREKTSLSKTADPLNSSERIQPVVHAGEFQGPNGKIRFTISGLDSVDENDLFSLARFAIREKRYDEAMALYLSIPPGSEDYARAQRFIGWKLLTQEKGETDHSVSYVNRALFSDPFD
ncbi:MAG: hypothetical protein ACI8TQ_000357 [Planctomycetota bacterium]|jgi:hypothetical protein